MNHNHGPPGHSHGAASATAVRLVVAMAVTIGFVMAEVFAAWWGHSLALFSDAGHNLADAAALGFSCYAVWIARKPSNAAMTYGYHRVGILAALVNSASLVVIAVLIAIAGIERLRNPLPSSGPLMIGVAAAAVLVNGFITFYLHQGSAHDLNLRSAYLHMLGDAVSALGVVIAGVIVWLTGSVIADPVVSFVIAALILYSSWGVLKESVNVLLEGSPRGLDMQQVREAIRTQSGVCGVHDLHVWTVGPGMIACSCHILVCEQSIRQGQEILARVASRLNHDFHINHTTIQIELEGDAACRDTEDSPHCNVQPHSHPHPQAAGHQHHH